MLKKRRFVISAIAVFVILFVLFVVLLNLNSISYTVLDDSDFVVSLYKDRNWYIVSDEDDFPSVKELLNIDEKAAVEIADRYFKDCSDRKYKVYYVEELNAYFVTVRLYTDNVYINRLFNIGSESSCNMLISKENGAILNMRYVIY